MDSIRSLLDESTLQRIANEAGQGVTEQQVEDVLNAVLPGIEKDTASGRLATRAAEAQQQTVTRGGTRAGGMDLLSMLLGGNASTATQTAASNANVSSGQAGSILKIAAPILIYLLLSKTGSSSQSGGGLLGSLLGGGSSQSSGGGLLGSLLGGGSSQSSGGGSLLGSLLGGGSGQQSSGGDSLLGMLLGGGNDADANAGSSLLGSLLSDSGSSQASQQSGGGSLLGSLLGGGSGQQSGGGSLLGSLLGGDDSSSSSSTPAPAAAAF